MLRNKRLGVIAASVLISAGALLGVSVASAGAATTAHKATAATVTTTHAAPPGRGIGAITFRECSGQTTTWVQIDIVLPSGLQDWCFGGRGTWQFHAPNNIVTNFCSGNNYGTFSYSGVPPMGFLPGIDIPLPYVHAGYLTINGWRGSAVCTS
jgi:hypothetical protein